MSERTDTDRLEWLEKGPVTGILKTHTSVYLEMDCGTEWVGVSFRDAIDAAMEEDDRG